MFQLDVRRKTEGGKIYGGSFWKIILGYLIRLKESRLSTIERVENGE